MAVVFRSWTATSKLRLIHLECHKIFTNDVFKNKHATKKLLLLFLELGMHKPRYNQQVFRLQTKKQGVADFLPINLQ